MTTALNIPDGVSLGVESIIRKYVRSFPPRKYGKTKNQSAFDELWFNERALAKACPAHGKKFS